MRKIVVYIMLLVAFGATAQNTKMKSLEEQRKKAQREVAETQQLLNENKKTTSNALNRLSLLKTQISSRREVIRILNAEIEAADSGIINIESNVGLLEKELTKKKDVYAESIRKIYLKQNKQSKWLFVFSADNFFQSYRRIQYLKEFSKWEKRQAEDVIKKQNQLNEEKTNLLQAKTEKLDLLQNRKEEEEKLVSEENTQKSEVKELQANRKQLNTELSKQQKRAAALNQAIEKAIAEEIARVEREAKAAREKALAAEKAKKEAEKKKNGGKTTASTTTKEPEATAEPVRPLGKLEVTKEDQALSGSFLSNKGKLPYPLKGNFKIVSGFGEFQDPKQKRVARNSSGINIQTTKGNSACSVFNGVVTKVFVIPGESLYGVVVRHGNYLSIYGNLVSLSVQSGDNISAGQALGTVYTDPDSNSTILHFEIWEETKKLNPLSWLR